MSSRITHLILSECEIAVERLDKTRVRVRIVEKNKDLLDPTDFEVEGDAHWIADAFVTVAAVLTKLDDVLRQEPS
jgi:hypothetical protein